MLRTISKLENDITDEVRQKVFHVLEQFNINRSFYHDSIVIRDAINSIGRALYRIKVDAKPQWDKEQLAQFKSIEEGIKKRKKK